MRGRTNVGGGGIAINATVENKEIASGNIIPGDFVEYYSNHPYIDQTNDFDFKFAFGDYSIALMGSILVAFKNGEWIDSFADYNCKYLAKYNNFIIFYDSIMQTLGVVSIVNDEFTLIDTIATSIPSSSSEQIAIVGGNNKVCVSKFKASGTAYIGVATISNNGELSNFVMTESGVGGIRSLFFAAFYDNKFYLIYSNDTSSSYSLYSMGFEINNENVPTAVTGQIFCSVTTYGKLREIYRKNNIIIITFFNTYSQFSENVKIGKIAIINFVTGNTVLKDVPEAGEVYSYIHNGLVLMSGAVWSKYLGGSGTNPYRWIANKLNIFSFNENTFDFTKLDSIVLPDDYGNFEYNKWYHTFKRGITGTSTQDSMAGNNAGIDSVIYYQWNKRERYVQDQSSTYLETEINKDIYLYELTSANKLQEITIKNYVRPFQNGGAIGVAKDAGTVGDFIDVYIPHPVS